MEDSVKIALYGRPQWNMYDISDGNPEHALADSALVEYLDISGYVIEYYQLDIDSIGNPDQLYGENSSPTFNTPKVTRLAYVPTEEPLLFNAFGIQSDEIIEFAYIPKTMYLRDVISLDYTSAGFPPSAYTYDDYKPKVGDVIKTLWNNRNYEISYVMEEQDIHLAKKFSWNFILKPFRYSGQSESHTELKFGENIDLLNIGDSVDSITTSQSLSGGHEPIESPETVKATGDNDIIEEESDTIYDKYNVFDPDELQYLKGLKHE